MNSFLFIITVALYTLQISVEDLVFNMTLEEKAGQMVEAERADILPGDIENYTLGSILSGGGSVPTDAGGSFKNKNNPEGWVELLNGYLDETSRTRLQIPIIYGMDSVHGANNVIGATIFPHNINYGATFVGDELKGITNVQEEGKAVQEEVRALGLSWTYGPFLGNPQNIHWGRTYEGFSSNITIPTILGPEFIKALQKGDKVAACMKHYIGEGYTTDGINRGYANLTEDEVRDLLPPYKAAVDAGALTLMPSFSRINGIVCSENEFILTTLLKEELGFKGFVVSDWDAVRNVSGATLTDQVANTINAGMDMIMATTDVEHTAAESRQRWIDTRQAIIDGVNNGTINQSRVDDAVLRILRVKEKVGLLNNDISLVPGQIGTPANRALARKHVSDSLVLLKNKENIVNRLSSFKSVLVAGQGADDIGMQCGGWTLTWQGGHGPTVPGTSILDGLRAIGGAKTTFAYSENAISATPANSFDAVIVVVGEDPYAEWFGDIWVNQSDVEATHTGTLRPNDVEALQNAYKLGIPVIVIIISGRPMYLGDEIDKWDALIAAFLPGSEAGDGIADVLFGDKDFVAKLSYTWPKTNEEDSVIQFEYGFGLTKKDIQPAVDKSNIQALVQSMTLEEKAGQMVQAERVDLLPGDVAKYALGSVLSGGGSVPTDTGGSSQNRNNPEGWVSLLEGYFAETATTRLKIPIIYGMDSVHGANNVFGATIFPHNINYGATYVGNETVGIANVQEEGTAVQEEVRALGIPWTFAPFLGNPQNIHWGRTYEGFSSKIEIPTVLGPEFIKAVQKGNKVGTCMKHYLGEGFTTGGINRGNAILTEAEIRALLPPYKAAVDAGALTLMPSFSRINGTVCSEYEFILTTLLKEELGFKGFVVSDWDAVRNVSGLTHKDKVANTINAGMDMIMATTDVEHTAAESRQRWIDTRQAIIDGVNDGTINQSRVDDAVERILWVKQQLGLIDNNITLIPGEVGTQAHRNIARRHVSDSLVLLKNKEDIIGRLSSFQNILVAGQGAEDIGMQCGGWTLTWQGDHGPIVPGTTLLSGFRTVASGKNFVYSENATPTVTNFDAVIVVVGEDPYAEWFGDIREDQIDPNTKQTGTLRESDLKALQNAYTLGVPVIVIVISGRPLYLGDEVDNWDALIAAFLPGSEAGLGIADVLFGNKNFIAKLSYEWPKSKTDNITIAYPFGAGLSKTPTNNGDTINSSDEKKKEVSPGIIVALLIIVAVVALLALIILIVVCVVLCRKGGYQSIIN